MKLLFVFVPLIAVTMAQRPTYAGSGPKGRPGLASRFKDENDSSTTVPVNNRVGIDITTGKIPVDARGDGELVDRLNQWPREHRPFWLLNADHIEAARNPGNVQGAPGFRPGVQSRSFANFNGNDETIPVRPNQPRSSFLRPLN